MGRGKVQLKLIENRSLRKSMYVKRFGGIKKKAYELSKLCDIPVMVISVDFDGKVNTYPENKEEVDAMLKSYSLTSDKVLEKNKQNPEKVIHSQILKKKLELDELKKGNENMLSAAANSLDCKLIEVQNMISYLKMHNDTNQLYIDTQMSIEESGNHDDVPNLFEVETLLTGNMSNIKESHFIVEDMDDMDIVTHTEESAYSHEHDDITHLLESVEFSIEDILKESGSDSLDDYLKVFSVEDLLEGNNSSLAAKNFLVDNMGDLDTVTQMGTEKSADLHEFDDFPGLLNTEEFPIEALHEEKKFPVDDTNDLQIIMDMAKEGSAQFDVFSDDCSEFSEQVFGSTFYGFDDLPFFF